MNIRNLWVLCFVFLLSLVPNVSGYSTLNADAVQHDGTIVGRVLDATNNRPVPNALISVGSLFTATSDPNGAFIISNIPIGHQEVTASVPGYERNSVVAMVHENQTTNIGYLRIMPLTGGPTAPPTPTPTAGPPTPVPAETPTPGGSASP